MAEAAPPPYRPFAPPTGSIQQGTVVCMKPYGAIVQLHDYRGYGLVHTSQLASYDVEDVNDVVSLNDQVWVKIISVVRNKNEETGRIRHRIRMSMKYASQDHGVDLDPTNQMFQEEVHNNGLESVSLSTENMGLFQPQHLPIVQHHSYRSNNANTNSDPDPDPNSISEAWLAAISKASHVASSAARDLTDPKLDSELDCSIAYLENLRLLLYQQKSKWHQPPHQNPPSPPAYPPPPQPISPPPPPSTNRFSPFTPLSDNDSLSDEEIVFHPTPSSHTPLSMATRRILIRILTALSELFSYKASRLARERPPRWTDGAKAYSHSFDYNLRALEIADEEYARFLNDDDVQNTSQRNDLASDAQVVSVAIAHFANDREKYETAAECRMKLLERKLNPQWATRDEVKRRLGDERWNNNPNPKRDYAVLREEDEKELKELRVTLETLRTLDTKDMYDNSQKIVKVMQQGENDVKTNKERYNMVRPKYNGMRVAIDYYPDPTDYGWTFTGSCEASRVEFYETLTEDGVIKLDFYYSTGTVKTSLDHPTRGKTQLFAKGDHLSPDLYRSILENPRVHTNARYHTRRSGSGY